MASAGACAFLCSGVVSKLDLQVIDILHFKKSCTTDCRMVAACICSMQHQHAADANQDVAPNELHVPPLCSIDDLSCSMLLYLQKSTIPLIWICCTLSTCVCL